MKLFKNIGMWAEEIFGPAIEAYCILMNLLALMIFVGSAIVVFFLPIYILGFLLFLILKTALGI